MLSKLWLDIRVFFVKHFYGLALTWWKFWSRTYRQFDGYSDVLSQKYAPYMLTVSWISPTKEILGHALCIGRNKDGRLFHLGNWGYRPGFANFKDLCLDVARSGGANGPLAWAILDKDLNMMTWGKGTPEGPEYNNVLVTNR